MKKKVILGFILCMLAVLAAACAKVDVTSPATVVLTVDTPVAAENLEVTATAGTVTAESKTFTVALPDRRPVTITVSSDGFKTVTRRYGASAFKKTDTVRETVELKTQSEAVLQFTVSGISGATVTAGDYPVSKNGNRYTVLVPGRDNLNTAVTVSAAGYEPRTYTVTKADLFGGYYFRRVQLAKVGHKLIEGYGFDATAFTRDFKPVTGRTDSSDGSYDGNRRFYEISTDDKLMLTPRFKNEIRLIDGADAAVPTYGYTVAADSDDGDRVPFETAITFGVDISIINVIGRFYIEYEGTFVQPSYLEYAHSETLQSPVSLLYVPGPCTLYLPEWDDEKQAQWSNKYTTYELTEEMIAGSAVKPFTIGWPEKLPYESQRLTGTTHDMDEGQFRYYVYDAQSDEYLPVDEDPNWNLYQLTKDTQEFTGSGYIYHKYYRQYENFTFTFDRNVVKGNEFLAMEAKSGFHAVSMADGKTTVTLKGAFDAHDCISFTLNKLVKYVTDEGTDNETTGTTGIGRETYCFRRSELTKTDDGYTLTGLQYHDYAQLYVADLRELGIRLVREAIAQEAPALRYNAGAEPCRFVSEDERSFSAQETLYVPAGTEVRMTLNGYSYSDSGSANVTLVSKKHAVEDLLVLIEKFRSHSDVPTEDPFGFTCETISIEFYDR